MPRTLEGLTVIDLTQNIAGPYCTELMGDFGATVIKVERPDGGDDVRRYAPIAHGESASFLAFNRNKRSICVDVRQPAGQEIVRRFASHADVFAHSLKPGGAESFGLDYERLSAANPRLIYCSLTGFGAKGPLRDLPGYDAVAQAYSGAMTSTGHAGDPPARIAVPLVDMGTGMWLFIGVLAALIERSQSGRGGKVDTSLLEVAVTWNTLQLANFMANGRLPEKSGSASPVLAPYQAFKSADGNVFIAAGNDRLFVKLCAMLGREDLPENPRYATNAARVTNREELREILDGETITQPSAYWIGKIREFGIPGGPINSVDRLLDDEQVAALGMLKPAKDFRVPGFRMIDIPLNLNDAKADLREMPPRLGEHTDDVMRWAGYSGDEIAQLRSTRIIA
ncbi:MAG: CoA transferase [Candidatus Binataceae bacterium]|nr:CoA transferase [Candidatus Binataceae bacterium]